MSNFFERQEAAERSTTQLVVIFGITVLLLILGLYVTVLLLLEYGVGPTIAESGSAFEEARASAYGGESVVWLRPRILVGVSAATLAFIYGARTLKLGELMKGGHVVAQRLRGTKLDPARATGPHRQLLNVVEEMAIAAGVPTPAVYVLPEMGINAFSAGFTSDDAVIGVTKEAIVRLDRDELQGLVAHELSHILNGDMRINLRLVGWTHGFQLLSTLGQKLLYTAFYFPIEITKPVWKWTKTYFGYLADGVRHAKDAVGGCALTGLALLLSPILCSVGGYILLPVLYPLAFVFLAAGSALLYVVGLPPGRMAVILAASLATLSGLCHLGGLLIQARVSREREFLADAAAVQFTRNPAGIGGALLKLRDCDQGGALQTRHVGSVRHLFFGEAAEQNGWLARWLSTHPPIEERLRHIDPALLEDAPPPSQEDPPPPPQEHPPEETQSVDPSVGPSSPEALIERAGTLTPEMLAQAQTLHTSLPTDLLEAAHEPLGAVALSYGLMLDDDESIRSQQFDLLWEKEPPPVFDETKRLYDLVARLDRSLRLPLVEVAAPSLRELSANQQDRLRETLRILAEADDRLTIFEFALETIVRHYLNHLDQPDETSISVKTPGVWDEVAVVLSGLARAGHEMESEARIAFNEAYGPLAEAHGIGSAALASPPPDALGSALDRLARTPLSFRQDLLQACARCVMADETITQTEEDLLRAVAIAMGVPLPVSGSQKPDPHAPWSESSDTT